MDCNLCGKTFTSRRRPHCPSCVQASLYPLRLTHASALLAREKSHAHAEAVLRPDNDGVLAALPEDVEWESITAAVKRVNVNKRHTQRESIENRLFDVKATAADLRRELDECRSSIAARKLRHQQRRRDLEQAKKQFDERRGPALEPVQVAIKRARSRMERVHARTAEAREYLCRQVADLFGLQRVKLHDGSTMFSPRPSPDPKPSRSQRPEQSLDGRNIIVHHDDGRLARPRGSSRNHLGVVEQRVPPPGNLLHVPVDPTSGRDYSASQRLPARRYLSNPAHPTKPKPKTPKLSATPPTSTPNTASYTSTAHSPTSSKTTPKRTLSSAKPQCSSPTTSPG